MKNSTSLNFIKSAQLGKEFYQIINHYEFIEYLFHIFISITKLDMNIKKQFYLKKNNNKFYRDFIA